MVYLSDKQHAIVARKFPLVAAFLDEHGVRWYVVDLAITPLRVISEVIVKIFEQDPVFAVRAAERQTPRRRLPAKPASPADAPMARSRSPRRRKR